MLAGEIADRRAKGHFRYDYRGTWYVKVLLLVRFAGQVGEARSIKCARLRALRAG